tara:strand:- start:233 stop:709 length:477 start_codon:yes stop_codon:yes gene_type:complete
MVGNVPKVLPETLNVCFALAVYKPVSDPDFSAGRFGVPASELEIEDNVGKEVLYPNQATQRISPAVTDTLAVKSYEVYVVGVKFCEKTTLPVGRSLVESALYNPKAVSEPPAPPTNLIPSLLKVPAFGIMMGKNVNVPVFSAGPKLLLDDSPSPKDEQ